MILQRCPEQVTRCNYMPSFHAVPPTCTQYYESFVEGPHLFISMELVEGVSLLDHINSLTEKGRRMPEADIWQVIAMLCVLWAESRTVLCATVCCAGCGLTNHINSLM